MCLLFNQYHQNPQSLSFIVSQILEENVFSPYRTAASCCDIAAFHFLSLDYRAGCVSWTEEESCTDELRPDDSRTKEALFNKPLPGWTELLRLALQRPPTLRLLQPLTTPESQRQSQSVKHTVIYSVSLCWTLEPQNTKWNTTFSFGCLWMSLV